jgi:septal ring factor EnvC (AmiA/AmiB activator)
MSESNGANPRLDRIEGVLETIVKVQSDMQQEHKMLLTAQVVQGDELRQLAKRTDEKFQATEDQLNRLAAAQERMDEALTALMGTVDEIIRSRKGPAQGTSMTSTPTPSVGPRK